MNPYAEQFVQTLRTECLDHFIICGERHLHHLVTQFVAHYLEERPYQGKGIGNVPLPNIGKKEDEPSVLSFPTDEVRHRTRLGGLLKHYYRVVA